LVFCAAAAACVPPTFGLLEVHDAQLATGALLDNHVVHLGDALPQLTAGLVEAADIAGPPGGLLGGLPLGNGLESGHLAHDLDVR
jgi:hypothetical protein